MESLITVLFIWHSCARRSGFVIALALVPSVVLATRQRPAWTRNR
jgi:hypothetical protein